MKIRLIGLGKMGFNLALNMKDNKFDVLAFDLNDTQKQLAKKEGIQVWIPLKRYWKGKTKKWFF